VIEGFDVSHRAGAFTRAAMVRFVDGDPDKGGYRTFAMRTVGEGAVPTPASAQPAGKAPRSAARQGSPRRRGPGREVDDYASIEEAVGRRLRGLAEREEQAPDLVLVDGGAGQLAAARSAIAASAFPGQAVCALAKVEELVFLPGRVKPIRLPRNHGGLQLLQRVRDEAHRFGIAQVRRKATQSVVASPLDEVHGVGPSRRAALVKAFGGLEGLRAATPQEMALVPGVTAATAHQVWAALNPEAAGPAGKGGSPASGRMA